MATYTWQGEFISAEEVSQRTGLDLTTVYQTAMMGEIPGAVWDAVSDETLRFKRDEFFKWWQSEVEDILRELEEEGKIVSIVGPDGQRRYYPK